MCVIVKESKERMVVETENGTLKIRCCRESFGCGCGCRIC
jgi:hypothetical protein